MGRSSAEEFGSAWQHVTIWSKLSQTSAKIWRHLWLCIYSLPLTLIWT